MIEFREWPKIPRLKRGCTITEKIDGTNAAVIVLETGGLQCPPIGTPVTLGRDGSGGYWSPVGDLLPGIVVRDFVVAAQSRKRVIAPGKTTDNAGFAAWVRENAEELAATLGPGYHYGEWWGAGIQRGYGQDRKWFSLFNTARWAGVDLPDGVLTVPVLYDGDFSTDAVDLAVEELRVRGSFAAPGQRAEGVVVYHAAARASFKVTLDHDAASKGELEHAGV